MTSQKRSIEVMDTIVKATQEAGGGNALAVSSGDEIATILDLLVPGAVSGGTHCKLQCDGPDL